MRDISSPPRRWGARRLRRLVAASLRRAAPGPPRPFAVASARRPFPRLPRRAFAWPLPLRRQALRHHVRAAYGWQAGRRWPSWQTDEGLAGWVDVAWIVFSLGNLAAIVVFTHWETIPFHVIWISFTVLYGFRVWAIRPTMWVLAVVIVATFAAISVDVWRGAQPGDQLSEVPLMAAMFGAMVWHARRRLRADHERALVSEENARLLATQRRFLQDASHQLRTPITIALGHAELLAGELAGRREGRDIEVVVGELTRLRRLGERLLVIAASEDPDFLRPEPVALERFTMEVLRKWMPTAPRRWRVGRLDAALVHADRERLGLAVDALLENAVRHTGDGDAIELSVVVDGDGAAPRMIIADTGAGIPSAELAHIFDRFRTGPGADGAGEARPAGVPAPAAARGTGLGLALVRAVASAHGGDVRVRSTPGSGSQFELVLPGAAPPGEEPAESAAPGFSGRAVPAAAGAADLAALDDPWGRKNL